MDFRLPREQIEALAGPMSEEQAVQLCAFGEAILKGSRSVNLVSRRSLGSIGEHMVDSSALLSFSDPTNSGLADLGSGAGFPGMVVAVLRPDTKVTMVDSRRRKVVFLKDVARRLGLDNVTVVHARLEDLTEERAFELATARALGSVGSVLAPCLRLVAPGGRLVLFKGPAWEDEQEEAEAVASRENAEIIRTEPVQLPGFHRSTVFVEFHVKQMRDQ